MMIINVISSNVISRARILMMSVINFIEMKLNAFLYLSINFIIYCLLTCSSISLLVIIITTLTMPKKITRLNIIILFMHLLCFATNITEDWKSISLFSHYLWLIVLKTSYFLTWYQIFLRFYKTIVWSKNLTFQWVPVAFNHS